MVSIERGEEKGNNVMTRNCYWGFSEFPIKENDAADRDNLGIVVI